MATSEKQTERLDEAEKSLAEGNSLTRKFASMYYLPTAMTWPYGREHSMVLRKPLSAAAERKPAYAL